MNFSTDKTEQNLYNLANIPTSTQNNYTVGATYKNYRLKGYSLLVISSDYLDNKEKKFQDNHENKARILDYASKETENKFRFENVSRENGYKINFGLGTETAEYTTNTYNQLPFGSIIYNSRIDFSKYNLFGQLKHSYFDQKLNLSLGVRSDANTYSTKMNNLLKTVSPRFFASYSFTNK